MVENTQLRPSPREQARRKLRLLPGNALPGGLRPVPTGQHQTLPPQEVYPFQKVLTMFQELKDERQQWFTEWRQISTYILPGRGIYSDTSRPSKRKLSSSKVVNDVARSALFVLTSGLHGGLTTPSRPWFSLSWEDEKFNEHRQLKIWLEECARRLQKALQISNFYSKINSFFTELCGFGTGCIYLGEDSPPGIPFRFETLTVGEYMFSTDSVGQPEYFMRVLFLSPQQIVEKFDNPPKEIRDIAANKSGGFATADHAVLELVAPYKRRDGMNFVQLFYHLSSHTAANPLQAVTGGGVSNSEPMHIRGFHEFPYLVGRWDTIGSDVYGVGPGSSVLPEVKRLQEIEKAALVATHKKLDPPINAPARLRGKLKTLPGARNYYSNPTEVVTPLYKVDFDMKSAIMQIERIEQRIQKMFFNDIFLIGTRDPNATPYKATEVTARQQEKMLRLGPVIERLQHEMFQPMIKRAFNIMLRKGYFPELDPGLAKMVGDYRIDIISPLATAQRAVALNGLNSFMVFLSNAARIDPNVLDRIDSDAAVDEYADVNGVSEKIIRPLEAAEQLRKQRAEAAQAKEAEAKQLMAAKMQLEAQKQSAETRKLDAEAGAAFTDSQIAAMERGLM